jgi:ectoine hydroxylase-related dioxygenase (phytanoyl-CoA dioxygenase family)
VSLSIVEQSELAQTIERDGWAVTPPVVAQLAVDQIIAELAPIAREHEARGGIRDLLEVAPAVRALATSAAVRSIAEAVLGPECFAVRAILFDKTVTANWKVTWHQDVTIAVRSRGRAAGYGPWSEKLGVTHVQPPAELLERMLAVRVHLDDCGADNGPVRVLPRSHRVGRLSPAAIDHWRSSGEAIDCLAERGAVLAFRPLLLHASSVATVVAHRRVVHFDFAAEELPSPLEWHGRVA